MSSKDEDLLTIIVLYGLQMAQFLMSMMKSLITSLHNSGEFIFLAFFLLTLIVHSKSELLCLYHQKMTKTLYANWIC